MVDKTERKKGTYVGGKYVGGEYVAGPPGVPIKYPFHPGYKIIFYNRLGLKIGEISSEIEKPILSSLNFELLTNGCGDFKIILLELPMELEDIGYGYRCDIHLFGDSKPWFSGYIMDFPQPGSTENSKEFSGFGFYNQLDDVYIQVAYTNKQVSAIVHDLMKTIIEPETDIVYHSENIASTNYIVQNIRWDHISGKEVMKELAEITEGYIYGVDENRRFFFRPKDTNINQYAHWWAGKHLNTFIPKANYDKLKNKLHIYAGIVTEDEGEKTNYIYTENDIASQNLYGKKAEKLTLPSALDISDVEQWGAYKKTEKKDPIQIAKITGIEAFKYKIDAKGKARITSKDGLYEYILPIERVKYNISSDGLKIDVELGQKDISFTEEQLKLMQKLSIAEALANQRLRQS